MKIKLYLQNLAYFMKSTFINILPNIVMNLKCRFVHLIKMMRNLVFLNSYFPGPDYTDHHKSSLVILNPMLVWPGLQQISDWFWIFSRAGHMQFGNYCLNYYLYGHI